MFCFKFVGRFSFIVHGGCREVLQKIEEALQRIEDGTYGFCLGTGKPIGQARLKAIPYAEHCLKHQEELDNENP